ncbi:hypothetical protein VFPPC_17375 [Pochonia chlamydosporia 170]|uniref:Uncharacterized protein n=1 Tax=Pochonia chlamydosporia 170 TaxID=1380566 RepID=A0A219ARQ7_METCM|nr:hypothetical protein VFPPC_17375 [Pochonia chlamydosporia 170]OWT43476.1 hypothetical protein VFPPC_17375 [Pochonia chlamydosporia 170]
MTDMSMRLLLRPNTTEVQPQRVFSPGPPATYPSKPVRLAGPGHNVPHSCSPPTQHHRLHEQLATTPLVPTEYRFGCHSAVSE